ncbi:MAG: hypothetical protein OXU61_09820 [Gammaproteobacteria bacterium]|nr:hypothetical protein [Gammaproteobacteria bacterium]
MQIRVGKSRNARAQGFAHSAVRRRRGRIGRAGPHFTLEAWGRNRGAPLGAAVVAEEVCTSSWAIVTIRRAKGQRYPSCSAACVPMAPLHGAPCERISRAAGCP